MRVEDALQRYVVQLEADGRSPHTVGQAQRHVVLLARWLATDGPGDDMDDLTHEHVAAFLASPTTRCRADGRPKKAGSMNALRSSVRTFLGYTHAAGYAPRNAGLLVRRARCGPPLPRALSREEVERLTAVLAKDDSPAGRRDQALFTLMLRTGVRIGSALAATTDDLDLSTGVLHIRHGKGDREQIVPLDGPLRALLRRYVREIPPGRPLFAGRSGRPITCRYARQRFAKHCKEAGLLGRLFPHCLRHTFATRLYARSRDLRRVQVALGHRSIASTVIYSGSATVGFASSANAR